MASNPPQTVTMLTDMDIMHGNLAAQPRMRITRNDALVLSTDWQRVDFSGAGGLDDNTFPIDPGETAKRLAWDATNKVVKFTTSAYVQRIYNLTFLYKIETSKVLGLGVAPIDVFLRFVSPANAERKTAAFYFPFADSDKMVNLTSIERGDVTVRQIFFMQLYSTETVYRNGIGVELCIGQSIGNILHRPKLTYAAFVVSNT